MPEKRVLSLDDFYNLNREYRAKYEDEFYMVVKSEKPVEVFRKFNWNEKTFESKFISFKKKYGEAEGITANLENWFKQYLELKNKNCKLNEIQEKDDDFQLAKSIVEDIIVNQLSIYEYCHLNAGYRVQDVKNFIRRVYYSGEQKIKEVNTVIEEIEANERKEFMNELLFIKNEIMNNDNFTVIDYYLSTKLHIDDFIDKVGANVLMNNFVCNNFYCSHSYFYNRGIKRMISLINKQQQLKLKTSINGREITPEEKEAMFKFFEENSIPLNTVTYRVGLRKIADNDLDFNQKINTYKGSF